MAVTTTRPVLGMSCDHCVNAVTAEVGAIGGVRSVDVDLDRGLVTVVSDDDLADEAFAAAIDEAGFEVGPT